MILEITAALALGVVPLVPGHEVRGAVGAGETRGFSIVTSSEQFITGVVDQGEIDLAVSVLDPGGARVATYDARKRGPELVSFYASVAGAYRIEVRTVTAAVRPALFSIRFENGRPKTHADDQWIAAAALTTEAKLLFDKRDAESTRQAIDRCRRALTAWRALDNRPAELAVMAGLGFGLYVTNDYAAADESFREALTLSRQLGDRRTEAEVLNNLAANALPLGHIPEAVALLRQALDLWHALNVPYGEASASSNLGVLLWQSGDFDEARWRCERAIAIVRSLHDRRGEAFALNNAAMVLDTMGERSRALAYLARAAQLFRQTGDRLSEGGVLTRRARIQLAIDRPRAALASARAGLQLTRQSADRLAEADALEVTGRAAAAVGDPMQARQDYEAALALYGIVKSRRGQADALQDLGVSRLAAGDAHAALPFFTQALELRRALGLRSVEAETLARIAQAERQAGDFAGARGHAEAALAIVEQLRAGVLERELRASYSSVIQRYYAEYVDLLIERHRREPDAGLAALAFDAVERARARGHVEQMRESLAGISPLVDAALLTRERELRREIHYWSWQLWQQGDRAAGSGRDAVIRATLDRLLTAHGDAEAEIRRADPRRDAWLRPPPVPLAQIQREIVDEDSVLVEYFMGEQRGVVWAITADRVEVAGLPGRAAIERRARRFYRSVSTDAGAGAPLRTARDRDAAVLSRTLLAPISIALARRRVIIVADGALHFVPFAALPTPGGTGPLAVDHEIVILPSATTLALLRRDLVARPPAPNLLAVLADPVFDPADVRVKPNANTATVAPSEDLSRRLSRLPFSREEGDGILSLARSSKNLRAFDFDASRAVAISDALSSYRFIHFATHAVANDEHPDLSAIVLSLIDRAGRPQNGFLRLNDVYNLRLRADMVVLSACETAVGKQAGGEGLQSLARGFFHAGAARVVAPLWRISDESAAAFMKLFYGALLGKRPRSPAAALKTAQLAMRAQTRWSDPYYWAAFVLQGEP